MDTWKDINLEEYDSLSISELRTKLWKENKIKLEGYTYSEWVEKQEAKVIL